MTKIKIAVVEDEMIIADNICQTLEKLGYDVTEPASTYDEGLAMLQKERPDIVLLDISLRGRKDGVDLAWKVKEDFDIPFIFLTANADAATVDRAKQTDPPAYLLKPFNKDDLYTSIEIAIFNFSKRKLDQKAAKYSPDDYVINDALFIKDGYCFHKAFFKDILFLESDNNYVSVHTIDKQHLVRTSLQSYAEHFDPKKFFRIHRSYVINLDHIQTINSEIVVINKKELPIGKSYRDDLLSKLKLG
jgi:two-component system, LytTR family, response regulator LytT